MMAFRLLSLLASWIRLLRLAHESVEHYGLQISPDLNSDPESSKVRCVRIYIFYNLFVNSGIPRDEIPSCLNLGEETGAGRLAEL